MHNHEIDYKLHGEEMQFIIYFVIVHSCKFIRLIIQVNSHITCKSQT